MIGSTQRHRFQLLVPGLLLSTLLSGGAFCQGRNFPDVPLDNPAYSAVKHVADRGVCIGFPDGSFRGPSVASRYEVAVESSRLVPLLTQVSNDHYLVMLPGIGRGGQPPSLLAELCSPRLFPDVPGGEMYSMAVQMLSRKKIFPGRPDGSFHGDAPTLRSDVAVILYNLLRPYLAGVPAGPMPHYGDVPAGSPLSTAVAALGARGVLLREPGMKTFDPEHPMTHYEWAVAVDSALSALDSSLKNTTAERAAPIDLSVRIER